MIFKAGPIIDDVLLASVIKSPDVANRPNVVERHRQGKPLSIQEISERLELGWNFLLGHRAPPSVACRCLLGLNPETQTMCAEVIDTVVLLACAAEIVLCDLSLTGVFCPMGW